MVIGKSVLRKDGWEKVTGQAMYTDDLVPENYLVAKVLHSTIANGLVEEIDIKEAMKIPGVVHIVTCFDVPNLPISTAAAPWAKSPEDRLPADRLLLNKRVRYYGDDIAVVVADNQISASRALAAIKVKYTQYPVITDVLDVMKGDIKIPIHEKYPDNILAHSHHEDGDFQKYSTQEGLIKVEGFYESPPVQAVYLENATSFAYMKGDKITVYTSTQCPHLVRQIIADAIGISWGRVRVVKPYVGGGFGVKSDSLYEPLNAYLAMLLKGHCIKLETTREENFVSTRTRHGMKFHMVSYVRKDGTIAARRMVSYSNTGAYASHGHAVGIKPIRVFKTIYKADSTIADAYSIYTNLPTAGALRGYGFPQATFALESHMDDIAKAINMDSVDFRRINLIDVGFHDPALHLTNYTDSLGQCLDKGLEFTKYREKQALYQSQNKSSTRIKRGIGMSLFWYRTGIFPEGFESSSCRIMMNQDGSVQVQIPETDIGQGSDTALSQLVAQTLGIPYEQVDFLGTQDTDVTPYGNGTYASRVTYVGGMSIHKTATLLKQKILSYAGNMFDMPDERLDIQNGNIINNTTNETIISLSELAMEAGSSMKRKPEQFSAECDIQCLSGAFSTGACFVDVEIDIPLCKVKVLNVTNVHDCGTVINPQLAIAQIHGGISMSIGAALSEQLIFDENGKCLNPNMLDYKILTAMDHPEHMDGLFVENPEPTSPYGTKSLGEPCTIPCSVAMRNAVLHATGVAMNELPLSPHNLFKRFSEEGLIQEVKSRV